MDSKTARHLIDELSRSDATVAQWQALAENIVRKSSMKTEELERQIVRWESRYQAGYIKSDHVCAGDLMAGMLVALRERDRALEECRGRVERLKTTIEDAPCPKGVPLEQSFVVGKLNIYCRECPDLKPYCWKRQALARGESDG